MILVEKKIKQRLGSRTLYRGILGNPKGPTILVENKITPLRSNREPIRAYPRPVVFLGSVLIFEP